MIEITVNHPESQRFIEQAGKLILNCGVIEMTAIDLIEEFSDSSVLTDLALKSQLGKRLEILIALVVNSTVEDSLKIEVKETITEIRPLLEIRNIVAHNPIGFAFPGENTESPSTVSGIVNFRPKDKTKRVELLGAQELANTVNKSANVAGRFREILRRIDQHKNAT